MHYEKINNFTHLIYNPLPRKKVSFEFIYTHGGSILEDAKDRGKKHLLEHCIVSRTKTYNFSQFKDYTFAQNIDFNAYTGPQTMGLTSVGYYQDFQNIADLLLEMAFEPTFDQEILDREKEIVIREIAERSGRPDYKLHYNTTKQVFTPESLVNHQVLGDAKLVAQTTLSDFKKLHAQNLEKSHFVLLVSGGGIEVEYLKKLLQGYTQNIKSQAPAINYQFPNQFLDKKDFILTDELAHEHVEINLYIPLDITFENRAVRSVFEYLYLKYGGILYDKLRDELGLVYSLQSAYDTELNMLGLYLTAEKDGVLEILNEIKKTFGDFAQNFKEHKFFEFKNLIHKKQEMAQDELNATNQFIFSGLSEYGQLQDYDQFIKEIDKVDIDALENLYSEIEKNWSDRKIILLSKDAKVQEIAAKIEKV